MEQFMEILLCDSAMRFVERTNQLAMSIESYYPWSND